MNDLIEPPKSWHARVTTGNKREMRDGTTLCKITSELVYDYLETKKRKRDVTTTEIIGDTYHSLTGPTGEASIREMATELNREKFVPSDSIGSKTRADGFKQQFEQAGGESLFDCITLKESISYHPTKKLKKRK